MKIRKKCKFGAKYSCYACQQRPVMRILRLFEKKNKVMFSFLYSENKQIWHTINLIN